MKNNSKNFRSQIVKVAKKPLRASSSLHVYFTIFCFLSILSYFISQVLFNVHTPLASIFFAILAVLIAVIIIFKPNSNNSISRYSFLFYPLILIMIVIYNSEQMIYLKTPNYAKYYINEDYIIISRSYTCESLEKGDVIFGNDHNLHAVESISENKVYILNLQKSDKWQVTCRFVTGVSNFNINSRKEN